MYFLEVFSTFLLFLFIGAFFSPFIGGCLSVIIVFTILLAFIVFFSINFVWFLFAGVLLYIIGFIAKYWRWNKLPDVQEYQALHPECRLDAGVACYNCGSAQLVNRGLINKSGKLRYYTCSQCGTTLFRFKVL